jgi:hypothetical protein
MKRSIHAMMYLLTLLLVWQPSGAVSQPITKLNCKSGPVTKTYGRTSWLVYGCEDGRTVIVVAAPGNPATPFYFRLSPQGGGYHLTGEGTGKKEFTDPAYRDLSKLSEKDIAALVVEAQRH